MTINREKLLSIETSRDIVDYITDETNTKVSDINIEFLRELRKYIRNNLLGREIKRLINNNYLFKGDTGFCNYNDIYNINTVTSSRYPKNKIDNNFINELKIRGYIKDTITFIGETVNSLYSDIKDEELYKFDTRRKLLYTEETFNLRRLFIERYYLQVIKLIRNKVKDLMDIHYRHYNLDSRFKITHSNITSNVNSYVDDDSIKSTIIDKIESINIEDIINNINNPAEIKISKNKLDKLNKEIKELEEEIIIYRNNIKDNNKEYTLDRIDYKNVIDNFEYLTRRINEENEKYKNMDQGLKRKEDFLINRIDLINYSNISYIVSSYISKFMNNIITGKIISDYNDYYDKVNLFYKTIFYNYYHIFNNIDSKNRDKNKTSENKQFFQSEVSYPIVNIVKNGNGKLNKITDINDLDNNILKSIYSSGYINYIETIKDSKKNNKYIRLKNKINKMNYIYKLEDIIKLDNKIKDNKNKTPLGCSSFLDFFKYIEYKLIYFRAELINYEYDKDIVDKNKERYMYKRDFLNKVRTSFYLNYFYSDDRLNDFNSNYTDLFLFYYYKYNKDNFLELNLTGKLVKIDPDYKIEAMNNLFRNMYLGNNNPLLNLVYDSESELFNVDLVWDINKNLFYRLFNMTYLSSIIIDRVYKIVCRFYYYNLFIKDKKNKNKNNKDDIFNPEDLLINLEDIFKDEYIEYLDYNNTKTIYNEEFLKNNCSESTKYNRVDKNKKHIINIDNKTDRFLNINYKDKLTVLEEYTLVDNEYIINNIAAPIIKVYNNLIKRLVSLDISDRENITKIISRLIRLTVITENIKNHIVSYGDQETDASYSVREYLEDYVHMFTNYVEDYVYENGPSDNNTINKEYWDLINYIYYNNNHPYRGIEPGDETLTTLIRLIGDMDIRDYFYTEGYEELYDTKVRDDNLGNLNMPHYEGNSELSGIINGYLDTIAESRTVFNIKIKLIEELDKDL